MAVDRISSKSSLVSKYWSERKPFNTTGALKAIAGKHYTSGRMPSEYANVYNALRDDAVAYTVLSYDTPIAWVLSDGTEVKPPVKYSVTTSQHQGRLY